MLRMLRSTFSAFATSRLQQRTRPVQGGPNVTSLEESNNLIITTCFYRHGSAWPCGAPPLVKEVANAPRGEEKLFACRHIRQSLRLTTSEQAGSGGPKASSPEIFVSTL